VAKVCVHQPSLSGVTEWATEHSEPVDWQDWRQVDHALLADDSGSVRLYQMVSKHYFVLIIDRRYLIAWRESWK
jgi:hypothetical protein